MTPFAVIQRAARLAPELDLLLTEADGPGGQGSDHPWSAEHVLRALQRAGLTLEADLMQPSTVSLALKRLGAEPRA